MRDNEKLPVGRKITLTEKHIERMRLGRFACYNLSEIEGDHVKRLQSYVKNIHEVLKNGYGMYLHGAPGSGKSTCAAAVLKELGKRGFSCMVVSTNELNSYMAPKGNVEFDSQEDMLQRLRSVHVLVINDLGAEYKSANSTWMQVQLHGLLNDRRNSKYASTIFTSNLDVVAKRKGMPSPLAARYTRDLASLISEMSYPIHVVGEVNFRQNRQEAMEELFS